MNDDLKSYGFDLSWSRIFYARKYLERKNISDLTLCTGSLFEIPCASDSIDVVYTSHSIEPNGGREIPILKELYRVTRKYLILLEPAYDLTGIKAKKRMEKYGYCKNLKKKSNSLGYKIIKHELFPYSLNSLNPTGITIIQKEGVKKSFQNVLVDPKFKTPLHKINDMFFSPEALAVYPIINDIPCLRTKNAIFASKYNEVIDSD